MSINEFSMHVSAQDVQLSLDRESRAAAEQGLPSLAKRLAAMALAIRNAEHAMTNLRPQGHRLQARLVFDFVPDVNVVLRDDVRERGL
jgi:hypothetical protein